MIAIGQSLIFLAAGLRNYRYAILLFLLFAPFAPRALGYIPTGAEVSLTFPRIGLPLLIVLFLLSVVTSKRKLPLSARDFMAEPIAIVLLVLGLHKIFASYWNGAPLFYAFESLMFTFGAVGLFYLSASPRMLRTALLAMAAAVLVILVIMPFELALQRPLYYFFADPAVLRIDRLELRTMGRGYRAHGFFDNSLSLAEFMLYCIPPALYFAVMTKGVRRNASWLLVAACFGIGFLTGSRGFLLFGALTIAAFFTFFKWDRLSIGLKAILIVVSVPVALLSVLGVGYVVEDLIHQASGLRFDIIGEARDRSLFGRALQFEEVLNTVLQQPLTGYGVLQNFSSSLDNVRRLDNFYLRSLLESGIPGFTLFILSMVLLFRRLFGKRAGFRDRSGRAFVALGGSLIIAFAGAKVFLSMPAGNFVFYALMGLLLGVRTQIERDAR
ncbi:MAG: O-antigen ligase family protein [Erythrobacter sp.]